MGRGAAPTDHPAMDIASFLPPILSLVVVPAAIGATVNVLNRNQDDDASPTLFSPLVNPHPPCGPVVPEVDFEPFHLGGQSVLGGTIDPGRPGKAFGHRVPSPTLA
jgi:hypothetical protein